MGILSRIFGSDEIIKAGINTVDKIVFTDEERADSKKEFLKLYEPFKLNQRIIAWLVVTPYVVMMFTTWALSFYMSAEQLEYPKSLIHESNLGDAAMIIVAFYFGGGLISSLKK